MNDTLKPAIEQIERKQTICSSGNLNAPGAYRPDFWALPSRDFAFPAKLSTLECGQAVLYARCEAMLSHPFLLALQKATGIEIRAQSTMSYHAVDLATDKHWQDLYETRQFCNGLDWGVSVQLHSGGLSPMNARKLLRLFEVAEPLEDPVRLLQRSFADPRRQGEIQGRIPVNPAGLSHDPFETCWAKIIGIERGWLDNKGGLRWTQTGVGIFGSESGHSFTESSGQVAFAF